MMAGGSLYKINIILLYIIFYIYIIIYFTYDSECIVPGFIMRNIIYGLYGGTYSQVGGFGRVGVGVGVQEVDVLFFVVFGPYCIYKVYVFFIVGQQYVFSFSLFKFLNEVYGYIVLLSVIILLFFFFFFFFLVGIIFFLFLLSSCSCRGRWEEVLGGQMIEDLEDTGWVFYVLSFGFVEEHVGVEENSGWFVVFYDQLVQVLGQFLHFFFSILIYECFYIFLLWYKNKIFIIIIN